MQLDLGGHPLHTRTLTVRVDRVEPGSLRARGELVDLRKRGFVPVAGDLQPSGPVHHMRVEARVDTASGHIERIGSEQPRVAFEPSPMTRGESCRDPAGALASLAGTPLDDGWLTRLGEAIGGPRGCSHVLVLARLVGSTLRLARARLDGTQELHRALCLDGHDAEDGTTRVAAQLSDLVLERTSPGAPAMDRFGAQHEVRLQVAIDLEAGTLGALRGAERRRTAAELASAGWTPLDARLAPLAGTKMLSAYGRNVRERLGEDDGPLLDALLHVGPTFLQCMGAMSESWPAEAQRRRAVVATGGMPDACWMWRRDGPLSRALAAELGGEPPLAARRRYGAAGGADATSNTKARPQGGQSGGR